MALEGEVPETDLAIGADLGEHLGDVGVDVPVAERVGDGDAVVPVLDEVQLADPVDVDRRHGLAAALGQVDPLPALADAWRGRAEGAVELARAVHRAHDRVERDQLLSEAALADAPERLGDLLEGQDVVHVVGAPEARGQAGERARRGARG